MKSILGILLISFLVFAGGFLFLLPLYFATIWVCVQIGIGESLSNNIALVLVTTVDVVFGASIHETLITSGFERELKAIKNEKEKLENQLTEIRSTLEDTMQSSPWLASKIADAVALIDGEIVAWLRAKKHPALKAAEQVKEISKEKRELLRQKKELEYQIQFYEGLFPWLEEFKTLSAPDAMAYVHSVDDGYDYVRAWLSPEEYSKLSVTKKNQLALDRYKKRKKTDWEVGVEYERYIGYLAEKAGFRVLYNGATQGISDMGRDIIATDGQMTLVIQCKRWAKEKEIHEKHIFQLYGTTVLMQIEKKTACKGVFITSARLSQLAKKCALFLGIEFFENIKCWDYPLIKCNVSKEGEKIYHLPFDQQYDRVQISGKRGAMFAWTVAEAEENGFRRAKRWIPE